MVRNLVKHISIAASILTLFAGVEWRPLFWFGAGPPVLIIAFRLCLPETDAYIERQRVRAAGDNVGKTFIKEGKVALKRHWLLLIYLVLLMAGMNFM